jgi:hypothetical protein
VDGPELPEGGSSPPSVPEHPIKTKEHPRPNIVRTLKSVCLFGTVTLVIVEEVSGVDHARRA